MTFLSSTTPIRLARRGLRPRCTHLPILEGKSNPAANFGRMVENASRTRKLIEEARRVVREQSSASALVPLLDEVVAEATEAAMRFEADSTGNPEVQAAERTAWSKCFKDCLQALQTLRDGLDEGNPARILTATEAVEKAIAALRDAQTTHQRIIASGPTAFIFLNRVIAQFEHLQEAGTDRRFALALMADVPEFLTRLEKDVSAARGAAFDEERALNAQRAVVLLAQELEALKKALGKNNAPTFQAAARRKLVEAAATVTTFLQEMVQTTLASGPTAIMPVNMMLTAIEGLRNERISTLEFLDALTYGRTDLQALTASTSATEVVHARDAVNEVIERIAQAAREHDLERLQNEAELLKGAAYNLALFLNVSSTSAFDDDELLLDVVEHGGTAPGEQGLPRSLQDVLDAGTAFLAGGADRELVLEAAARLDRMSSHFREIANNVVDQSGAMPTVHEGVSLIEDAAASFRTLAQTGDTRALDAARALLTQAASLFKAARGS